MKKFPVKRVLGFLLVLVVIACAAFFISTRYSDHTTYVPLTGKIFDIQPDQYTEIVLQHGPWMKHYNATVEKEEIAEVLNGLRYSFWLPTIPIESGGWDYRLILRTGDTYIDYIFSEKTITVNGVCYLIPAQQLRPMIEPIEWTTENNVRIAIENSDLESWNVSSGPNDQTREGILEYASSYPDLYELLTREDLAELMEETGLDVIREYLERGYTDVEHPEYWLNAAVLSEMVRVLCPDLEINLWDKIY